MSRRALTALAALALTTACGAPPGSVSRTAGPGAEALRVFEQGDCNAAAPLLREALVRSPQEVPLHYALGVCASRLDIRQEAITHFQWVVANAAPESPEARAARDWLVAVGVIRDPQPAAAVAASDAAADPDVGQTTVRGRIITEDGSVPRLRLFLKGRPGTPTAEFQYVALPRNDGRFEFSRIPAGTYVLSDTIVGKPRWRLRVEVPASGELDVPLTVANAFPTRDDFPEDGT